MPRILVYGSLTCEDTERSIALLNRLGVPFEYRDVDEDEAAAQWAGDQNAGHLKTPTIWIEGRERVLIEPSDPELQEALTGA